VSDVLSIQTRARQAIHNRLSFPAVYTDDTGVNVTLNVRWHGKGSRDTIADGGGEILAGVDSIIFDSGELTAKAVILLRNGIVTLPPALNSIQFRLDALEPSDGPVNVCWVVARTEEYE
jgi:hypothetical protein